MDYLTLRSSQVATDHSHLSVVNSVGALVVDGVCTSTHPQQLQLASSYFGPAEAERLREYVLGGGFCQFHWYRIIFTHCPPGRLAVESGVDGWRWAAVHDV